MAGKRRGTKAKYEYWLTDDGLLKIKGWARDGLTDLQIAQNIGIAYSTFRTWRDKYPALSAALKNEKQIADRNVENALYKRAIGYEFIEKRVSKEQFYNVVTGRIEELTKTVTTNKHVSPDSTAIIYWLKNRKPAEWRERKNEPDDNLNGELSKVDELLNGIDKLAGTKE